MLKENGIQYPGTGAVADRPVRPSLIWRGKPEYVDLHVVEQIDTLF